MHLTVGRHLPAPSCITPVGVRDKENQHKVADTHAASLVQPSLLPAFMKTNKLICQLVNEGMS